MQIEISLLEFEQIKEMIIFSRDYLQKWCTTEKQKQAIEMLNDLEKTLLRQGEKEDL